MRKISAVLACLLCLVLLLSACGKEPIDKNSTTTSTTTAADTDTELTDDGQDSVTNDPNATGENVTDGNTEDASNTTGVSDTTEKDSNDRTTATSDKKTTTEKDSGKKTTTKTSGTTKKDPNKVTTTTKKTNATTKKDSNKVTTTTKKTGATNGGSNKITAVRDLKGRVINYVAYWAELEKGSSQRANTYWKRKEEIEKKYNCKINHIYKSRDAIDTEVIPSILSGAPIADMFNVQQDRMYSLINKKVIYPMSDLKEFDFSEEKWNPAMVAMSTVDGKVYGLNATDGPYCNTMLLYNKDYFDENNLPDLFQLQKEGKFTWAKFREIAKTATKGDVKGFAMTSADEFMVQSLIHANGGMMVSRGKGLDFNCTLNTKNTINAMQFWQDMRQKDKSVLDPGANGYNYCMEQFAAGKAAMHLGEVYQFPTIANKVSFEVGAVLFPAGPDSSLPYMLDMSSATPCVMSANTKNPADVAMVWDAFAGADLLPWEEYYYDMFYNEEIVTSMRTYRDLVRSGKYLIDYGTCVGNTYELGIHGGLTAVAKGEKTPAQVVEEVQGKLHSAINMFN